MGRWRRRGRRVAWRRSRAEASREGREAVGEEDAALEEEGGGVRAGGGGTWGRREVGGGEWAAALAWEDGGGGRRGGRSGRRGRLGFWTGDGVEEEGILFNGKSG